MSRLGAHSPSNGHGSGDRQEGLVEGVGSFGANVLNLASLQTRLAVIDAQEASTRALPAVIGLVIASVLTLAAIIVGLFALGLGLAKWLDLSEPAGLAIVAGLVLAICGVVAYLAVRRLTSSFEPFRRSREELDRNVSWLKTVVSHSGR